MNNSKYAYWVKTRRPVDPKFADLFFTAMEMTSTTGAKGEKLIERSLDIIEQIRDEPKADYLHHINNYQSKKYVHKNRRICQP